MNNEIPQQEELSNGIKCSRRCHQCSGKMQAATREFENSTLPWRASNIRFNCCDCQHTVAIADPTTIITSILSALFIISILSYAFLNGFLSFIGEQFSSSISWMLFAVFLSLIVLLFCFGAFINLYSGISNLRQRAAYPILESEGNTSRTLITFILGALPWAIAIAFGFLFDQFLSDEKWLVYLMLPVVFSPILLASKLKISPISVFLACIFWGAVAGFIAWLA